MVSVNAGGSAKALTPEWPARSVGILNMSPRSGAWFRRRSSRFRDEQHGGSARHCCFLLLLLITTQEQPHVLCALITPRGANRSYCRCSTQLSSAVLVGYLLLTLAPMPQYTRGTLNPRFLPRFCAHSPYGVNACTKEPGTHTYMSMALSAWRVQTGPSQSLNGIPLNL